MKNYCPSTMVLTKMIQSGQLYSTHATKKHFFVDKVHRTVCANILYSLQNN